MESLCNNTIYFFAATVPSLNPFLNRLDKVFKYRMRPVPVVILR
jgi:hypothetical protein